MTQITGRAEIRIDGEVYRSLDGATITPGGVNREPVKGGGRVHGFKEEDMEATGECKFAHTSDLSIKKLANISNATVIFEADTGGQFLLRNAFVTEPPALDFDAGEISMKFAAVEMDEIG